MLLKIIKLYAGIIVLFSLYSCESDLKIQCQELYDDKDFKSAVDICFNAHKIIGEDEFLLLALNAAEELSDFNKIADLSLRLSYIEWEQSNHREALKFAQKSVDYSKGDRNREIAALNQLSSIFEEIGSVDLARHILKIVSEKVSNDKSGNRINMLINQGVLELNLNYPGIALYKFNEALDLARGSKNKSAMRGLHLNLVDANLKLNRLDVAQHHLTQAWGFAESDGSARFALLYYQAMYLLRVNKPLIAQEKLLEALSSVDLPNVWKWEINYWIGKSAEENKKPEKAEVFYRKAIYELELLSNKTGFNDLKSHQLDKKRQPYEALFSLLAKSNKRVESLEVHEKTLTQGYINSFVTSTKNIASTIGSDFYINQTSDKIEMLLNYIRRMRSLSMTSYKSIEEILINLQQFEIISFFAAQEDIWIIRISKGKLSIHLSDLSKRQLKLLLSKHRANLDNMEVLASLGKGLFPQAVLPSEDDLLYIIPDSTLGQIAYAGLLLDGQHLIEKYPIAVVPNIQALVTLQNNTENLQPDKGAVLVLGDPNKNLPDARIEAFEVANKMEVEPYLGNDASFALLRQKTGSHVVHIATHSGYDHMGSFIALAEGNVYADAILKDKLAFKLVVLASCSSGAQGDSSIWGSLAGVFLSSGTQGVVASLWSVEDLQTRIFIDKFYDNYEKKPNAVQALANAQRLMIKQGYSPEKWSGLIFMGYEK